MIDINWHKFFKNHIVLGFWIFKDSRGWEAHWQVGTENYGNIPWHRCWKWNEWE